MELTKGQIDILEHTIYRAAGGLYCGGGEDMEALCVKGLMVCVGRKSFVPDPYYCVTPAGRAELISAKA